MYDSSAREADEGYRRQEGRIDRAALGLVEAFSYPKVEARPRDDAKPREDGGAPKDGTTPQNCVAVGGDGAIVNPVPRYGCAQTQMPVTVPSLARMHGCDQVYVCTNRREQKHVCADRADCGSVPSHAHAQEAHVHVPGGHGTPDSRSMHACANRDPVPPRVRERPNPRP